MTHYRLFRRRRILGLNDQSYLDRWPLALTPWGRVYLHRFHAPDPGLPPRSSVAVLVAGPVGRLLGNHENRDDLPRHRVSGLPPGDMDTSCRQVAPTAHDLDVGRHRADGADVGLLHTVGLGRILANRPQGRVLRQCRIGRASQIVQRLGVVRGTSG